jgi:hypothetical protein
MRFIENIACFRIRNKKNEVYSLKFHSVCNAKRILISDTVGVKLHCILSTALIIFFFKYLQLRLL